MIMSASISERHHESPSHSPVAVHEATVLSQEEKKRLEYLTVDRYEWPTMHEPTKSKAVTDEERRSRHREVQRRFMERKLNRLLSMRSEVKQLELRYSLMNQTAEMMRLRRENDELLWKLANAREQTSDDFGDVKLNGTELIQTPADSADSANANLPWDQILEAVCDPL